MAELTGYILDFTDAAAQLPPDAGIDYVEQSYWKLHDPFVRHPEKAELLKRRAGFAAPVVIGDFVTGKMPDATHDGMEIKPAGSNRIYLPGNEAFAVSVAHIVGQDLLKLYGAQGFQNAKMILVSKDTFVPPAQAHRPEFAGWHDHVTSTHHPLDLIYSFHTTLSPQYRLDGKIYTPQENTLGRFGGEIKHRSVENETDESVSRHWGAILVQRADTVRPLIENPAMVGDPELVAKFKDAATRVLQSGRGSQPRSRHLPITEWQAQELSV